MARKKKAENGGEIPGVGHNLESLSDDQVAALTFQHRRKYEAALGAKKKAEAEFKNVCKIAHAELGPDAILNIKEMIALETEEGEAALKAEIERKARVARWMGLPIDAQAEMFAEDRTPASDRAFALGRKAGLAGETASPPHAPDTEQYRRWMEGFHEGQAVLAQGFKPKPTAQEAAGKAAAEGDAHIKAVSEKLADEAARSDEAALMH